MRAVLACARGVVGVLAAALVSGVVESIDGTVVLVETRAGQTQRVSRSELPRRLREGDVLRQGRVDVAETRTRAAAARGLLRRLRSPSRRAPKGAARAGSVSTPSSSR